MWCNSATFWGLILGNYFDSDGMSTVIDSKRVSWCVSVVWSICMLRMYCHLSSPCAKISSSSCDWKFKNFSTSNDLSKAGKKIICKMTHLSCTIRFTTLHMGNDWVSIGGADAFRFLGGVCLEPLIKGCLEDVGPVRICFFWGEWHNWKPWGAETIQIANTLEGWVGLGNRKSMKLRTFFGILTGEYGYVCQRGSDRKGRSRFFALQRQG